MFANSFEPGPRKFLIQVIDADCTIIWQLRGIPRPISPAVGLRETVKGMNPLQALGEAFCSFQVTSKISMWFDPVSLPVSQRKEVSASQGTCRENETAL